jgi:hypothetical protein
MYGVTVRPQDRVWYCIQCFEVYHFLDGLGSPGFEFVIGITPLQIGIAGWVRHQRIAPLQIGIAGWVHCQRLEPLRVWYYLQWLGTIMYCVAVRPQDKVWYYIQGC